MYNRLIDFIRKKSILYPKQFGFREQHSTDHALLSIVDKIQNSIDNREYSCGIFLDLSKAFDTVNHEILILKLEHYGIRGVASDWFASYLSGRSQITVCGNSVSTKQSISCGVPQGSVLGPLLFLLYVNDFCNCSSVLDLHLFADDANLFYSDKKLPDLELVLNIELQKVHIWLCSNKLISLNVNKSNFVVFHSSQMKLASTVNANNK